MQGKKIRLLVKVASGRVFLMLVQIHPSSERRNFSIESSPNVEHSKMWSELDECALGADLRVIDSTFYFS